jgi:chromate transport protein ChrA
VRVDLLLFTLPTFVYVVVLADSLQMQWSQVLCLEDMTLFVGGAVAKSVLLNGFSFGERCCSKRDTMDSSIGKSAICIVRQ